MLRRRQFQRGQRGQRGHKRGRVHHPFIPKRHIDLNCNIGQGFGVFQNSFEEKIVPYVTSVNIACGAHAGDPQTMAKAVDIAKSNNVCVGALIGYNDFIGNGQREMYLSVDELRAMVLYQLGALNALLHSKGLEIRHVRTHGFLYRQMYTDLITAETVAKAIGEFSRWITLVGLSGQVLANACSNANIKAGHEVLISRRYRKDGTILPYNPNFDERKALEESLKRAREVIQTGTITCEDKTRIRVNADTIHLPSDSQNAIELARSTRAMVADPRPLHLDKYDKYFADLTALAK